MAYQGKDASSIGLQPKFPPQPSGDMPPFPHRCHGNHSGGQSDVPTVIQMNEIHQSQEIHSPLGQQLTDLINCCLGIFNCPP